MKEDERKCSSRFTTSKRQAMVSSAVSSERMMMMSHTSYSSAMWLLWYFTASRMLSSSPHWMHCMRNTCDSSQITFTMVQTCSHTSLTPRLLWSSMCSTEHDSDR